MRALPVIRKKLEIDMCSSLLLMPPLYGNSTDIYPPYWIPSKEGIFLFAYCNEDFGPIDVCAFLRIVLQMDRV